jgi:hypothetical protein
MVMPTPGDPASRTRRFLAALTILAALSALVASGALSAAGSLQPPEQFIGFKVGADNKLVRWEKIVEYMKLAAAGSDRVRVRDLGKTTGGNAFLAVEISAPETIKALDRHKQLARKLYFQGGVPSTRERDDIFRQGKVVVLVTCSVHANEIGATQAALELVHRLATDESSAVKKVLDNVIFVLVPSANPDGQIVVTDWFNRNLDTPYAAGPLPYLYHPYAGHDLNRDMYMFTQKESQYIAQLAWHDWFPAIWLDQHQMNAGGPRMFVMPAADPINPNVHPLIYRWNGILGQSQAAALEAAGKDGIIYNSMYTNFWQGAMAWSGWWHNQIGLLTEVASVRTATPTQQLRATPGSKPMMMSDGRALLGGSPFDSSPLAPPTDTIPRTEYPRPWMGGRWTLRDIVDYQLISTLALLEAAADRRETILRQIYEVNRQTVEDQRKGDPVAILIPTESQHDPREAAHLADRLQVGGVEVFRSDAAFEADGQRYDAGTLVVPLTQVFARYAKDLLEKQTYPEVRRGPNDPIEPPYDVTAWSLGMLLGVNVDIVKTPHPSSLQLTRVNGRPRTEGRLAGNGTRFVFDYVGADAAIAVNRLLKSGARVALERPSQVVVSGVPRERIEGLAKELGLNVAATEPPATAAAEIPDASSLLLRTPRIGLYSPWTGGNMDEGWTRWVLEQYEFTSATIHNADVRRGGLRQNFDTIIIPDQAPREIIDGFNAESIRPEYRGGIGEVGVENLARFVAEGGTLVTLGGSTDLAIDRLPIPVRNIKRGLRREQHYAPGTILRLQVDTSHPEGYGMAAETYGFYTNGPVLAPVDGFTSVRTTVVARYPAVDIVASGWLRGEEIMAGRAAVVSIEMNPGRVVLFGLRPQHRGQTHATFPLLFNALYLSAAENGRLRSTNQQ